MTTPAILEQRIADLQREVDAFRAAAVDVATTYTWLTHLETEEPEADSELIDQARKQFSEAVSEIFMLVDPVSALEHLKKTEIDKAKARAYEATILRTAINECERHGRGLLHIKTSCTDATEMYHRGQAGMIAIFRAYVEINYQIPEKKESGHDDKR